MNARLWAALAVVLASAQATAAPPAMVVEKDVAINLPDGHTVFANVYRPSGTGRHPVLLAQTPYGKDPAFQTAYKRQWDELIASHPDICRDGSTCRYMRWELPDPERWVPRGYVVVAVDARGTGKSPGFIDHYSARETRDLYDEIEWAARQDWSSGKIGLLGISYMAINQWQVAALQPPHLAAIVPWEGASDFYREISHHGGIPSDFFPKAWTQTQILPNQNGNAQTPLRDPDTAEPLTGAALNPALLAENRRDTLTDVLTHPFDDAFYQEATPDLARVVVPVLSSGNWGGAGLHLRGNIEGWRRAASKSKWLDIHGGSHFEAFYTAEGIALQARFLNHFLKGDNNGWERQPPIQLAIRAPGSTSVRFEHEWPLARTAWTRLHLDAGAKSLAAAAPGTDGTATYTASAAGVTFATDPLPDATEITGPLVLRVWIASSSDDADIFAVLRATDADGHEVAFPGSLDPRVPVAQGWLRASHRKLDDTRSTPWRPWHTHDGTQKLMPGEMVPLDVEIWPTSVALPKGARLSLTIQGHDFAWDDKPGPFHGSGPFLHNTAAPGPTGDVTVGTGGAHDSFLLIPVIPKG